MPTTELLDLWLPKVFLFLQVFSFISRGCSWLKLSATWPTGHVALSLTQLQPLEIREKTCKKRNTLA